MMLVSDFSQGGKDYVFKGKTTIWGKPNVFVFAYCGGGDDGAEREFFTAHFDFINKRLEWIENNRPFLESVLIENNMIELTEEWIQKAKDAEEVEKGVYALKDGQRISLPLKKEAFLADFSVGGLEIDFEPDEQKPGTDLYIHCTPDYFMGWACIQMEINYDNSVEECIILSECSPDKPWEV